MSGRVSDTLTNNHILKKKEEQRKALGFTVKRYEDFLMDEKKRLGRTLNYADLPRFDAGKHPLSDKEYFVGYLPYSIDESLEFTLDTFESWGVDDPLTKYSMYKAQIKGLTLEEYYKLREFKSLQEVDGPVGTTADTRLGLLI